MALTVPTAWVTPIGAAVHGSSALLPTGTQLAELRGAGVGGGGLFGYSVAGSAHSAVVGTGDTNRAYVFEASASGWHQTSVLRAADAVSMDCFGCAVAMAGPTIVVGASHHYPGGRAYVFANTTRGWRQTAELRAGGATGDDSFGVSVAASNNTIVVGDASRTGGGRAYVFQRGGARWRLTAVLRGADTTGGDDFGYSVAISGGFLAIGAEGHADGGAVYVFTRAGSSWAQAEELTGADTVRNDKLGWSVGISGTTVVAGAWSHARNAGRAYVFARSATGWPQLAELQGTDTVGGDAFGYAVAISGTTMTVGAYRHASSSGRAYVFAKRGSTWTQAAELKGTDTTSPDLFAQSVGAFGPYAVVGAVWHAHQAWSAYVFATRPVPATSSTSQGPLGWPRLTQGSSGAPVRSLQYLLDARGAILAVDGTFGTLTAAALASFQRGHALPANEVTTPSTWEALTVTVRQGSVGPAVRAVQDQVNVRNLRGTGFLPVTGTFDAATERAVRNLQDQWKIHVDGIVGLVTWLYLISEYQSG